MAMPYLGTRNRAVQQAAAYRHAAVDSHGRIASARSRPCASRHASEMPVSIPKIVAALLTLFACLPVTAIAAPVFTVNALGDAKAGGDLANGICQTAANNAVCTVRAAITKANLYPGGGVTINIPAGTYQIEIPPASPNDDTTGNLNITQTMTISGAGMDSTIIDGGSLDNVFNVAAANVSISGLTIQNGYNTAYGGGMMSTGQGLTLSRIRFFNNMALSGGGGLAVFGGSAVVDDSVLINNRAVGVPGGSALGGGVIARSSITFNRTSVVDNSSGRFGGGISLDPFSSVPGPAPQFVLNDTSVSGNQAANGGGIFLSSAITPTLSRTLVSANYASTSGGGIYAGLNVSLTLSNSTISANVAGENGGGIYNEGTTNAFHATIVGNVAGASGNSAATGGGVQNNKTFAVWNSLFDQNHQRNTTSQNAGMPVDSHDYNAFLSGGWSYNGPPGSNVTSGNSLLGPLKNNGGATSTHALLSGSVALDRIPPNLCRDHLAAAPTPDQRGVQRPVNSLCDIGAFEGVHPTPLFNANLIRNGDAESGGGTQTGVFIGIPDWVWVLGEPTVIRYNAPGYPNATFDTVPAIRGYNFFGGGHQSLSITKQLIDVTAAAAGIDAGRTKYRLAGDFGGYLTDNDSAQLRAIFRNAAGAIISEPVDIGSHNAAFRANKTGLFPASATGILPAGTRTIELNQRFLRATGASNDGYSDNLSLVLTRPSLDVDDNGTSDALSDGLLMLRYLFGLRGDSLIAGAIGDGAKRTAAIDIVQYLDLMRAELDVDRNAATDALTDGLLLLRYLFGLRGPTLIADAVGTGATRQTASDIESYIATLLP